MRRSSSSSLRRRCTRDASSDATRRRPLERDHRSAVRDDLVDPAAARADGRSTPRRAPRRRRAGARARTTRCAAPPARAAATPPAPSAANAKHALYAGACEKVSPRAEPACAAMVSRARARDGRDGRTRVRAPRRRRARRRARAAGVGRRRPRRPARAAPRRGPPRACDAARRAAGGRASLEAARRAAARRGASTEAGGEKRAREARRRRFPFNRARARRVLRAFALRRRGVHRTQTRVARAPRTRGRGREPRARRRLEGRSGPARPFAARASPGSLDEKRRCLARPGKPRRRGRRGGLGAEERTDACA